jgi:hypothetical protein
LLLQDCINKLAAFKQTFGKQFVEEVRVKN